MSNPKHVAIARKGAKAINEYRRQHPEEGFDLSGEDFFEEDLRGANLSRANIRGCSFSGTDLRGANLDYTSIADCDTMTGADLRGASLAGIDKAADIYWLATTEESERMSAQINALKAAAKEAQALIEEGFEERGEWIAMWAFKEFCCFFENPRVRQLSRGRADFERFAQLLKNEEAAS